MQVIWSLLGVFLTALSGIIFPSMLIVIVIFSLIVLIYMIGKEKQKDFSPQSKTYKEIEKLKKKRLKIENNKHKHINDQVAYIAKVWGYNKEQEKILAKFIEKRAYLKMYNKLTASFFPQIISMIDSCNAQNKKGCKREVARRLRELFILIKRELEKNKFQSSDDFETSLEVYDLLLREIS